jgi:hypothetical protein
MKPTISLIILMAISLFAQEPILKREWQFFETKSLNKLILTQHKSDLYSVASNFYGYQVIRNDINGSITLEYYNFTEQSTNPNSEYPLNIKIDSTDNSILIPFIKTFEDTINQKSYRRVGSRRISSSGKELNTKFIDDTVEILNGTFFSDLRQPIGGFVINYFIEKKDSNYNTHFGKCYNAELDFTGEFSFNLEKNTPQVEFIKVEIGSGLNLKFFYQHKEIENPKKRFFRAFSPLWKVQKEYLLPDYYNVKDVLELENENLLLLVTNLQKTYLWVLDKNSNLIYDKEISSVFGSNIRVSELLLNGDEILLCGNKRGENNQSQFGFLWVGSLKFDGNTLSNPKQVSWKPKYIDYADIRIVKLDNGNLGISSIYNGGINSSEIYLAELELGSLTTIESINSDIYFHQTSNEISITNMPENSRAKIFDLIGRERFVVNNSQISITDLDAGIYFLTVLNEAGEFIGNYKFVKAN